MVTVIDDKSIDKSVDIIVKCKYLANKAGFFHCHGNCPFMYIKKHNITNINDKGDTKVAYQSRIRTFTTNPKWEINNLSMEVLCNSSNTLPLIFEIWSYRATSKHKKYGTVETTLKEIVTDKARRFTIKDDKGKKAGRLDILKFEIKDSKNSKR